MDTLLTCVILSAVLSFCHCLPVSEDKNATEIVSSNNSSLCKLFNPCLNRGRCSVNQLSRYICECQVGYRGSHCQFIDYCSPNPCVNGVCLLRSDGFSCECNTGFVGDNCSIADPCVGINCMNGGTCTNRHGTAKCQCSGPYVGRRCENLCLANRNCWGSGIGCIVRSNRRTQCECTSRIPHGQIICILEEDVENECRTLTNPCNGGSCYDTSYGFYCSCPSGRSGNRCENKNPCYPSPCRNGGSCSVDGDTYRCTCNSRFGGKNCDIPTKSPCTVRCSATAFTINCEESHLPRKVLSRTLWSRLPESQSQCTCRFSESRRSRYYYDDYYEEEQCVIPFDSCGSKMQVINNTAVYNNFLSFNKNIINRPEVQESDLLVTRRRGDFRLNLECRVPLDMNGTSSSISTSDLNSEQKFDFKAGSRLGGNALTLKYYNLSSDGNRTLNEITTFGMVDRIYILISNNQNYAENQDFDGGSLSLSNCYASPQSQSRTMRYYLLENGCPRDETFRYETSLLKDQVSDGTLPANFQTLFSFEPFLFKAANDDIYVHCEGDLCLDGNCNICQDDVRISRRKRNNDEQRIARAMTSESLNQMPEQQVSDVPRD